jgi:diaminopimelate decarboxylase
VSIKLEAYAGYIAGKLKSFPQKVAIKFEPGKFLVSDAGVLLVKVNMVKQGFEKKFIGVNSGFHHLIRPMYYDAYHQIINLSNNASATEKYDIVGVLCEEDTFAYDRLMSPIKTGDILMIRNAGAYGASMVSEYNLRDKPKEVFIGVGKKRYQVAQSDITPLQNSKL